MNEVDAAIGEAWRAWHTGFVYDADVPQHSPVFAYGFRFGVERPGVSASVAWDDYAGGKAGNIPPALIEGINRGCQWGMGRA